MANNLNTPWARLTQKEKAELIGIYTKYGYNNLSKIIDNYNEFANGGKIHIKESKRGTFTAAAKSRGMGVQEFASKVLANKDEYSPAMVKKANFARNSANWHADGGPVGGYLTDDDIANGIDDRSVYARQILKFATDNPRQFWADREDSSKARQWLINNAPDQLSALYNALDDNSFVDRRFIPSSVKQREYQEGVTNAISDAGKRVYDIADTVTSFMPGPVGTINWLSHIAADTANEGIKGFGRDVGMAAIMAGGLGAIGKGANKLTKYLSRYDNKFTKSTEDLVEFIGDVIDANRNRGLIGNYYQTKADNLALELNRLRRTNNNQTQNILELRTNNNLNKLIQASQSELMSPMYYDSNSVGLYDALNMANNNYSDVQIKNVGSIVDDVNNMLRFSESRDNRYGNIRFIRNIGGLPKTKNGGIVLAPEDNIFANFTTDIPFRLHENYSHMPGGEYLIVPASVMRGKTPWSIEPMDTFFRASDIGEVDPSLVTFISGNEDLLNEASKLGLNTYTNQHIIDIYKRILDDMSRRTGRLDKKGFGYTRSDLILPYRSAIDSVFGEIIGRPSVSDYKALELSTGLKSGVSDDVNGNMFRFLLANMESRNIPTKEAHKVLFKYPNNTELNAFSFVNNKNRYRTGIPYDKVFYDPVPTIESDLLKKIGGYGHQKYDSSYEGPLKRLFDEYVNSTPIL